MRDKIEGRALAWPKQERRAGLLAPGPGTGPPSIAAGGSGLSLLPQLNLHSISQQALPQSGILQVRRLSSHSTISKQIRS